MLAVKRFASLPLFCSGKNTTSGVTGRQVLRMLTGNTRQQATSWGRQSQVARRKTLKEALSAPSKGTAFNVGQGALAGASVVGLGALAFYGLGLSNEVGVAERALLWPEEVKQRIRQTYAYFGASVGLTAASAVGVFRTPALLNIVSRQGWLALGASIAAMLGTGILARSIPYESGFGKKQLAWMAHCAVNGAVVAPLCLLGGPILTRAAWYTAGMIGGLTTVAVCAPSDKFVHIGGPLAMGFGVIFASSVASAFLPPTTALGAGVYSLALYGGLILFGGFILYDTQKIVQRAERHPSDRFPGVAKYDPIGNSIAIYIDTLNIFVRIAQILAMNQGRRK